MLFLAGGGVTHCLGVLLTCMLFLAGGGVSHCSGVLLTYNAVPCRWGCHSLFGCSANMHAVPCRWGCHSLFGCFVVSFHYLEPSATPNSERPSFVPVATTLTSSNPLASCLHFFNSGYVRSTRQALLQNAYSLEVNLNGNRMYS